MLEKEPKFTPKAEESIEEESEISTEYKDTNKEVEIKSEKCAQEKLDILMDDEFKEFGIRFANVGEYEQIMETRKFGGKEVFVFEGKKAPSFKQYIGRRKQRLDHPFFWATMAERQTDWHVGIYNMVAYNDLIALLHEAHRKANTVTKNKSSIREETMKIFQSLLREAGRKDVDWLIRCAEAPKHTRQSIKRKKEIIGEENLEIMRNFINNPDFLNTSKNLRSLIKTIAYYPLAAGDRDYERQYHLALVFDIKAISDVTSWGQNFWRLLKTEDDINYKPSDNLLGIIACMPDKELVQQLITKSSHGKEVAHVVFDDKGIVRYPKANQESEDI